MATRILKAEMNRFLSSPSGPVARLILKPQVNRVEKRAHRLVPKASGKLDRSIYQRIYVLNGRLVGEIGATADHAEFQEHGTGIYGPRKRRIEAKPGKVFVWQNSAGETVFARSTKGVKATHFLEKSLDAIRR